MYINAVANSVMLYLQQDFYNIIFKIKHNLYIASGSAPPPPRKNSGFAPEQAYTRIHKIHTCLHVLKYSHTFEACNTV